ncbi:NADP-dependent oxidoreductase [Amycolatopsis acidiphila]|uniref:NADP-dependent oxidoreductase n=1 Tax=Amycolatopsis acidiphila TaxID=715473 RepID=A0A558A0J8_9PSEU|nr:NADP-dependent oxidoreductase [Amycolatopsis acidiphila]TVT17793.1 NADP-dependent oxidoreductase [Amycolatopsis acidiphila]UIJ59118.1 NADP-dependent oxidoreductase [Amycolatopsis acidiphila]GHG98054.1 NADPH:quinone reductase [Amycolatopsis acidiphila]
MYAAVLIKYGPADVLAWSEVPLPEPGPGQIRIRVLAAGVGPTDLKIRRGDLQQVFPLPSPAVLGFEAAGTVDAVGSAVTGVAVGDEVAALLPALGGYAQYALASAWTPKPARVSWADAAALPASAEAAVGVLRQLHATSGETLLILGGGGSVGLIATQLAVSLGVAVLSATASRDQDLVRELGAIPVHYGPDLRAEVHAHVARVDAVFDAAGKGALGDAVELAGGPARVITLADEHAADHGVALSAPTPDRAPDALDQTMPLLASGELRLRTQRLLPVQDAAQAHQLLDTGQAHEKLILTTE